MRHYLNDQQEPELAELMNESPLRVGMMDEVSDTAAEHHGGTLLLADSARGRDTDSNTRTGCD